MPPAGAGRQAVQADKQCRPMSGGGADCDVAIVGAGPVGLMLGNLLARCGVSVTVLERQPAPYPLPRAVHLDGEAMRVFQAAGLAEAVLPHMRVGRGMLFRDRRGDLLVDWSRAQEIGPMGWHESYRFHQPAVERVMREALVAMPGAELLAGAEMVGLAQDADGVSLTLGTGATLRARLVVGADGAGSATRAAIGSGLHDLGFEQRWLVADLRLTRPRDDLGEHTVQFCDPDAPATYGRGVGDWRRWEFRLGAEDGDDWSPGQVWQRLARWIGPEDGVLERAAVYTFRSRIATRWRAGRVLLAGDAAHQMPPFMGQGLCAGLRDAANLWWKLRAVLAGSAAEALLDSYQSEREANARAFIERSVTLGRLISRSATGGEVPQGRMRSIWPDLGPGLGPRDGVGGTLAPQVMTALGERSDDLAGHRPHVLAAEPLRSDLPVIRGANGWLSERGLIGAVIRPDGYVLAGIRSAAGLRAAEALARGL